MIEKHCIFKICQSFSKYQNFVLFLAIWGASTIKIESGVQFHSGSNFSEIQRYDWRETIHKDYDDHSQAYFPHMDKKNGLHLSLNIEAKKSV